MLHPHRGRIREVLLLRRGWRALEDEVTETEGARVLDRYEFSYTHPVPVHVVFERPTVWKRKAVSTPVPASYEPLPVVDLRHVAGLREDLFWDVIDRVRHAGPRGLASSLATEPQLEAFAVRLREESRRLAWMRRLRDAPMPASPGHTLPLQWWSLALVFSGRAMYAAARLGEEVVVPREFWEDGEHLVTVVHDAFRTRLAADHVDVRYSTAGPHEEVWDDPWLISEQTSVVGVRFTMLTGEGHQDCALIVNKPLLEDGKAAGVRAAQQFARSRGGDVVSRVKVDDTQYLEIYDGIPVLASTWRWDGTLDSYLATQEVVRG